MCILTYGIIDIDFIPRSNRFNRTGLKKNCVQIIGVLLLVVDYETLKTELL